MLQILLTGLYKRKCHILLLSEMADTSSIAGLPHIIILLAVFPLFLFLFLSTLVLGKIRQTTYHLVTFGLIAKVTWADTHTTVIWTYLCHSS